MALTSGLWYKSICFHKNPCTCSSQRRESLAWLKLKRWQKIKPQKIYKSLCLLLLPNLFLCLTMKKVPLILRCVATTAVASFEGSLSIWQHDTVPLSKLQNLKDGLWHRICPNKRTKQRRAPAVSPGGKVYKGHHQHLSERGAGSTSARETKLGAPAGDCHQGRAAVAQNQFWPHSCKTQICWWGHFHVPFIYWAVSLTLPSDWAFPASSLHCCHSAYYLDLFFHTDTYITKQPSRLAVF